MKSYDTVTEALNDLQARGYTENFNLEKDCLVCEEKKIFLNPDDFEVDETYRFEGNTDPGDENVVYAISSSKHKIKGVFMSAFGAYADVASSNLLSKLSYRH